MTDLVFAETAEASARAAVREGPVGPPRRPPGRFPQQEDGRRCGTARRRTEALTRRAVELALAGDPTAMPVISAMKSARSSIGECSGSS